MCPKSTDRADEFARAKAVFELQACVSSELPLSSIRRVIDNLSQRYSHQDVLLIIKACEKKSAIDCRDETRLLLVYGRWLVHIDVAACEGIVARLRLLLSVERSEYIATIFALNVLVLYLKGETKQSLRALLDGFSWIEKNHPMASLVDLNAIAVVIANRLGQHNLALGYAYECHRAAFNDDRSYEIEMANFMVLNSSRLALKDSFNIAYDFEEALRKIESGCSKIELVNCQLLPVYAAFAELEFERPNWRRVDQRLALARELDAHQGIALCRRGYLLAFAKMQALQGRYRVARDALVDSTRFNGFFDYKLASEYHMLCRKLGVLPDCIFSPPAVCASVWRALEARLN